MRRLYLEEREELAQIPGCEIVKIIEDTYEGSMFCPFCPDGKELPLGCSGDCDPFESKFCDLAHRCPCAHLADARRLAAFEEWKRRRERKEIHNGASLHNTKADITDALVTVIGQASAYTKGQ